MSILITFVRAGKPSEAGSAVFFISVHHGLKGDCLELTLRNGLILLFRYNLMRLMDSLSSIKGFPDEIPGLVGGSSPLELAVEASRSSWLFIQ